MKDPILVYMNVSVMGYVNDVLKELIIKIKESGIIDYCHSINFIVNGDRNLLELEELPKSNVLYTGNDISVCEFPTITKIWEDSTNAINEGNDLTILYLHTKGSSRTSDNIKDWVDLLTYFNVTEWRKRVDELASHDCTGINLSGKLEDLYTNPSEWGYGKSPVCYSGNFWWSKASHISKLKNPTEWMPDGDFFKWRIMCEMWVCSLPEGNYNNVYSSNMDHYWNPYPKQLYIEEK